MKTSSVLWPISCGLGGAKQAIADLAEVRRAECAIFGTTAANGEPTDWLLETTSPSILFRLGWTRTSLKPGDRVQAQIHPLSDIEQHGGTLEKVTSLETGKTFGTNNREQEKPNLE